MEPLQERYATGPLFSRGAGTVLFASCDDGLRAQGYLHKFYTWKGMRRPMEVSYMGDYPKKHNSSIKCSSHRHQHPLQESIAAAAAAIRWTEKASTAICQQPGCNGHVLLLTILLA